MNENENENIVIDPGVHDNDKRIFSLYMAAVMQTLDSFEVLTMLAWMNHANPKTINDVTPDVCDMYDITIDDYRQFADQVTDFDESLRQNDELEEWFSHE